MKTPTTATARPGDARVPATLPTEHAAVQPLPADCAEAARSAACAREPRSHDFTRVPLQAKLRVNRPGDPHEQEADRMADQISAHAAPHAPRLAGPVPLVDAPPIVHEALRSPGRPLDAATRALMEPRFGHDFSRVRVHTDAKAEASAAAVDALAYTVGRDVVFGRGRLAPHTPSGQRLLAHELTHVVQGARSETVGLQRQKAATPRPPSVDADAQRIIALAQAATPPIAERAVAVVKAIIDQYYPADKAKISKITYKQGEPGLHVTSSGRGASTTGILEVGSYFVKNTTQRHFARRVLQVRHEIEHVEQYRAGMTGKARGDEREFAAFYHEALGAPPPGAGRLQHSTRVGLIDAALGYYNCLSEDLRKANAKRRTELLTKRTEAVRRSHNDKLGSAPTTCRRQR